SRSGMVHLPGIKRVPEMRALRRFCVRKVNNFQGFWQERLSVNPGQLQDDAMPIVQRDLSNQALLRVVPDIDLHVSGDPVVWAVLRLPGHSKLLRTNVLDSATKIFARIAIQQCRSRIAEFGIRHVPVRRGPDVRPRARTYLAVYLDTERI